MRGLTIADPAFLARPSEGAAPFDPETIGTPTAMYWASGAEMAALGAANGSTPTWPDEAGTADFTLPAVAGNRPLFRTSVAGLNNKPAFEFVSTDRLFVALTLTQPFDLVLVFKLGTLTQGTYQCVVDGGDATHRHALLTYAPNTPDAWWLYGGAGTVVGGTANTNTNVAVMHMDGANSYLDINGTQVAAGNAGTHSGTVLWIGSAYDTTIPMNGHIAFVGAYDTPLSSGEKSSLVSGLKTFYGVA